MKKRSQLLIIILVCFLACKKSTSVTPEPPPGPDPTPIDPPISTTIGFFLNDWKPKTFTAPPFQETALPSSQATVNISVDAADIITKIPPPITGQNANSWMTQIVTETALMNHLTNIRPGVIRFPGGSISDMYFWNALPNQKPTDVPDTLLDANGNKSSAYYWVGKNTDSWTISLDNYYNLLQQTGSPGMITVNYGYARYGTSIDPVAQAAHLAADWVRYDNGRTKYWEIGNECNGTWEAGYRINTATNQDGQPAIITGALYGNHVKIFTDSMKKAAQETGKTIYISAYLLEKQPEGWQSATDQTWNAGVLSQSNNSADYYTIHSYYTAYQTNASATEIINTAAANTTAMINYVKTSISNAGATLKPIALTEWNIFSQGSMQQVSFINGMHGTILMAEAIKNKYGQTSRWDLANGWSSGNDHGLFNIGDEPGVSKWNPRPAFYYLYYFNKMMGDRMLNTTVLTNNILAYASSFTSGGKGLILVNKETTAVTAGITIKNGSHGARIYWYTLTGGTDNGEFSRKVLVNGIGPTEISGGPASYATLKANSALVPGAIKVSLPGRSVVFLVIE
ncbi:MAG TPA: hypothetical protein VM012_00490 [Flavitalea sp.]|nr:hypothetical protein [Flavitalea sp.]